VAFAATADVVIENVWLDVVSVTVPEYKVACPAAVPFTKEEAL
jgi:hypothetical protein